MNDIFKTTDIILASVLRLKGYTMTNIERDGIRGTFVFSNVDNDIVDQFDLGNILVEPTSFNNQIKQLTTSVRRLL